MVTADRHYNEEHLHLLLQDRLSPAGRTEVITHLDSCRGCCHRLERLAADDSWWTEAHHALTPEPDPSDDKASANNADSSGDGKDADSDAIVSLTLDALEPANGPDMIGRLGEYEIVDVVGRGGMGVVLKGFERQLNRYVAVKVLAPQFVGNGAARKRFSREAQAAAAVVHQHVIAIHGVDAAAKLPYLVMPYVPGQSLQERIHAEGPLLTSDVLRIAMQTAEGLAAAHAQGLVHRDIKPANILLEKSVDRVLITDFGLARAVDDATVTRSGLIVGTPPYMSPEQARGENIDHRSDLFSLGSVMYAMCTGEAPFHAQSTVAILRQVSDDEPVPIRRLNPDIPPWLVRIVERLMDKNANARYQTATEVATLLERCIAHVQQPDRIELPRELLRTPATRRRAAFTTAGATIIAAAALFQWLPRYDGSNNGESTQERVQLIKPLETESSESAKPVADVRWTNDTDRNLGRIQSEITQLEQALGISTLPIENEKETSNEK